MKPKFDTEALDALNKMAETMCEQYCMYRDALEQKAWEEDRKVSEDEHYMLYMEHCKACPMMQFQR